MDSSSSSSSPVESPLSGNTQSSENTLPLYLTNAGFPPFGNIQSSEILSLIPSSSVAIPSSEIPKSSQNTQSNSEPQSACDGLPTLIVSDAEWNRELARLFLNNNFCNFMKRGACEEQFLDWYGCVHRVVYHGGHIIKCSSLAGVLRDCVFSNQAYHQTLLRRISNRISR